MLTKIELKYGHLGSFKGGATMTDDGVVRWDTNDRVVPGDVLAENGLPPMVLKASKIARDAETKAFLEAYAANYKGPSDEQRAEARAAHGAGVKMVNAITGFKWTT